MATYHFCTIATQNHLPHVLVLYQSILQQNADSRLHVLFVDSPSIQKLPDEIALYDLKELTQTKKSFEITDRYKDEPDKLRWALKPVFLRYLLMNIKRLIYIDNDICFYSSFEFLFQELSNRSLLLTPHWSPFAPLPHTADFEMNFKIGLFNAGFIGTTKKALTTLDWWADLCFFKMSKNTSNGYFVDQRYLDLLPVVDANVGIVRHLGCNVGGWNIHQNRRSQVGDQVVINEQFPIVFIHFNQSTLDQISQGNDPLLVSYLNKYLQAFRDIGYDPEDLFAERINLNSNRFVKIKTSIRLRTRLKNIVFKIYQKL